MPPLPDVRPDDPYVDPRRILRLFRPYTGRLLLVAAVFGIVNSILRPLLTVLTCPLIVITLGLFTLVINALMLLVTGWVSESWNLGFAVSGFWAAFFGGLVVGLVSTALSVGLENKSRAASRESREFHHHS